MKNTGFNNLILFLTFLIFSCSSNGETVTIIPQESYDSSFFQQLFEEEKYFEGLTYLYGERIDLQENDLLKFRKDFSLALSKWIVENPDQWDSALGLYFSLKTLDTPLYNEWDETDFYYNLVLFHLQKNHSASASALMLDNLSLDELEKEQLENLESLFIENPNHGAQIEIYNALLSRGLTPKTETTEQFLLDIKKSDLVKGTVTIWVDKGIRMEQGVGIPDRVIGSGFFIDQNGYLLTNYHVIASEVDPKYDGYSRLYIKRDDREGEKIPARVIGWDPVMDLALLKTEMLVPYSFSFTQEDKIELGDSIFAIGSPGGLEKTLTTGTISAMSRYLLELGDSLQVDVPINPGNSGGPLLNQQGQVIGVVYSGIEEFEGINFAIPGFYVKSLIPRLYKGGLVEYGWLGASLFKDFDKLTVAYTLTGYTARKAGLLKGDEIIHINDIYVESITQIQDILFSLSPGTLIRLGVVRDGKEMELIIPLDKRPAYPMGVAIDSDSIDNLILPIFGMDVERIDTSRIRRQYRVDQVYPGTIADETGIVRNDQIKLLKWEAFQEERFMIMQILLQGRSAGYMESMIQLGSWFQVNSFI